jgi:hydrogenase expression/formation protein HypD
VKYLEEFADPRIARRLLDDIHALTTRPWALMEVCGGQTHSILRHGIDQLLPDGIDLIHGPGCPVCVTPLETIDKALEIASRPEVIFCSFGDMLRVPGSDRDLFQVRSAGGDVRVVYSPLDALTVARDNPDREVVFFGIGFETTAPPNAMAVVQAERLGLGNFSMLVSHVLVPPAIEAIMTSPASRVQAFLAAGHVCSVMGTGQYIPLARRHRVPIVVTGFEPLDILEGIRRAVAQLEDGRHEVENAYPRAVPDEGNAAARTMLAAVFEITDRAWRGIGTIPGSGWRLSERFRAFDAEHRFGVGDIATREPARCRAGEVLQGLLTPPECEAFGTECTPRTPLGATMVSSEGACAAYYLYRRIGTTPVGPAQAGDPVGPARTATPTGPARTATPAESKETGTRG